MSLMILPGNFELSPVDFQGNLGWLVTSKEYLEIIILETEVTLGIS